MISLLYAFRFLTIFPIPWKQNEDLKKIGKSLFYFPFVGFVIGIILNIILYIFKDIFSPLALAFIITFTWVIITGGLHLDGLSDLFDGFGGKTPEDRLRIMKDSQIGVFGALSLIILILFKIIMIHEIIILKNFKMLYSLLLAPVWGRNVVLIVIYFFKTARIDGMAIFFKNEIKFLTWLLPSIISTLLTIYCFKIYSLILLLLFVVIILFVSRSVSKKLNGLTGDCYGAICEISELLFLILSFIFMIVTKV